MRSRLFDGIAARAKILFGRFGIEVRQIIASVILVRRFATLPQCAPRSVLCRPDSIQFLDRLVLAFEVVDENAFGNLLWRGRECCFGQG